ncbi:MAG: SBBP repeat-containing protein [Deltaproteobacteria bacterium]|nr:SBBP repeat-containing protein [Deltaproteobacteria bacterium]
MNLTLLLAFWLPTAANAKPLTNPASAQIPEVTKSRIQATFLGAPLHFEANQGQTDEQVKFLARGSGYSLFLTSTEAVLALREHSPKSQVDGKKVRSFLDRNLKSKIENPKSAVIRMKLVGANSDPRVVGLQQLPGKVNYFIGNDPKKWRRSIPTYKRIEYKDLYPGINLVFYGNQRQLEYDFVVSPGTNPSVIQLAFEGADKIEVDTKGDLILRTALGDLRLHKPLVYQEIAGVRKPISASYVLLPRPVGEGKGEGRQEVSFQLASYDATKALIIDPVLSYSTYLGGSGLDRGFAIAADATGNAYVTGMTNSTDFPTANPFQATFQGTTGPLNATGDAFVTKLSPNGSVIYSTYLGGSGVDDGDGIAVDASGNAYVTGGTNSTNYPTTVGAFQPAKSGGSDVFVTKLNSAGNDLIYSTYLGGSGGDIGSDIAVDCSGNTYVTGLTDSTNFPVTAGAVQTTFGGGVDSDAFVTKISPAGDALVYSTYLGGSGYDRGFGIAADCSGNAYVTGFATSTNFPTTVGAFQTTYGGVVVDAFVTKLNPAGSALVYSTYLGGSGGENGIGIAVDAAGNAYIAGQTSSTDFPTANPLQATYGGTGDGFVAKLDATGSALIYSTYLGGSGDDGTFSIAVDPSGNAYVTGNTKSTNFPLTNPIQDTFGGSGNVWGDAFVTKLNSAGNDLIYSTYLGGSDNDVAHGIALDSSGNAYVTGISRSTNFPVANALYDSYRGGIDDAFVAKITDNQPPTANAGGPYTVAEGAMLATLTGSGSDPDGDPLTYAWDLDNNGSFETPGQNPSFSAAGRDGPSSQTVVLRVCDTHNACATSNATVNITNVGPTVGVISAPAAPVQVTTAVTTSANFTDPGVPDTHTAVWSWGDGTTSAGTVTETNGSGSVTGSHTYIAAGVYTVTLTVTDDDGGSGQSIFQFVVVFDPSAGFVTGGGWINSPAGAYAADPSLTGKANFGFVSRYWPGATVPEGQTEFRFNVANLNFHSSNYEWLVVGGARAQYKGTGTINGAGSYSFILTAIDGQVSGGGGVDKFRIKIWGSGVIYDNQTGASDTADPTTQLGGGSIVIHTQ